MRELRLYSRAFNRAEKMHYLFDNDSRYLSEISTYLLFTIPFNDYRINNGQIMVAPKYVNVAGVETEVTLDELAAVCYVADVEYDDQINMHKVSYYFVRRCFDQSGNMILDVERDLWASSIKRAEFGKIHLSRCNREFGLNFKLPLIDDTRGLPSIVELGNKIPMEDVSVLFLMSFPLPAFVSNAATQTLCLTVTLKKIYDVIHAVYPEYDNINIVDKASDFIGGISEVNIGGINVSVDVSKVWIVPNEAIFTQGYLSGVRAKSFYTNNTYIAFDANLAVPYKLEKAVYPDLAYKLQTGSEIDLSQYVEIGTSTSSMAWTRAGFHSVSNAVMYKYVIDTNGLSVTIEQGTQHKDITSSFELTLSTNGATGNSLMSQARLMGKVTTTLGGIAASVISGNPLPAVMSVTGAGIDALHSLGNQPVNKSSSNGDGALTFRYSASQVNCPYAVRMYAQRFDYKEMLRHKGALYNAYITIADLRNMPSFAFFDGTIPSFTRYAYVLCDYLEVNGINESEEEYIKNEFARGIYVIPL